MKSAKTTILMFIAAIGVTTWSCMVSPAENATSTDQTSTAAPKPVPSSSPLPKSPFWEKATHDYDSAQRGYDEAFLGQKDGYHLTLEDVMAERVSEQELEHRPFLYFRMWANRPQRIIPMAVFAFLQTLVLSYVMKDRFAVSGKLIRQQFWRCLGQGFATTVVALSFVRPLFSSHICTPAANLIFGLVQLMLLIGLSATIILIGDTCLKRLGLADKFERHPRLFRWSTTAVGTIFVALIAALPRFGILPPVGIRLVLLFCMLGAGGLLRSNFGAKPQASENL